MKYEKPEVRMFEFEIEDVITTSVPFPTVTTTTTTLPSSTEEVDWGDLL